MAEGSNRTPVLTNRKALHNYEVLERIEAGIVLVGTEVKSIRAGRVNFKESYARIRNEEVWLMEMHISPYEKGTAWNHDPLRPRKLLLHKSEIKRLRGKIEEKGLTLIPLKLYFKKGRVKIELGLSRGKKVYDKRKDIAKRDARRDTERELKRQYRINL